MASAKRGGGGEKKRNTSVLNPPPLSPTPFDACAQARNNRLKLKNFHVTFLN